MAREILKFVKVLLFWSVADIFSAIRPIYLLTHFVGLSNYKVAEVNGRKCFKSTILIAVKSLLQFAFLIGIVSYNLKTYDASIYNTVVDKINYYQDVMACSLSVANVGFGLIFSAKLCKITNGLNAVDLEFVKLGINIDYRNCHKRCWFRFVTIVLSIFGYIGYIIYLSGQHFRFFLLFHWFANIYPYLINIVAANQYSHYAMIIRDKYKELNGYLEALFENAHGAWFVDGNKPSPKIRPPSKLESDKSSWIDTVACFHIKLADIATLLNEAFRVQLLLSITTAFIGLVTALFLIAINFKDSKDDKYSTWNYVFICWAFVNALALVLIVHTTSRLCDEANRCPKILHKIRNKTADSVLHETIEMYSLQMYHNRLQFHVCGLFPLDYTLLYTIVASVTTHLVILIQFNSAQYHGSKRSSTNNISEAINNTI